jgi:hypothetical protein
MLLFRRIAVRRTLFQYHQSSSPPKSCLRTASASAALPKHPGRLRPPALSPSVYIRQQPHPMAAKQPPWEQPKKLPGVELPPLRIYNSLTKTKNDFVPLDPEGKTVLWYACGPTTYDISHLGKENLLSIDGDQGINCWKVTLGITYRYEHHHCLFGAWVF